VIPLDQRVAAARDYATKHGVSIEGFIRWVEKSPRHNAGSRPVDIALAILDGKVVPVEGEGTRP
jgi:hypothetical protein